MQFNSDSVIRDVVNNRPGGFPALKWGRFAFILGKQLGQSERSPQEVAQVFAASVEQFAHEHFSDTWRPLLHSKVADVMRIILQGDVDFEMEAVKAFRALNIPVGQ